MEISWIRIYLLAGLVLHKGVWEIMKARQGARAAKKTRPPLARVLSAIKVAVLLAILAQTSTPEILPISADPSTLRASGRRAVGGRPRARAEFLAGFGNARLGRLRPPAGDPRRTPAWPGAAGL